MQWIENQWLVKIYKTSVVELSWKEAKRASKEDIMRRLINKELDK